MKKLKFLSGIPRSGSTLLNSLLNQRPDTYASNTSNLCDMICAFNKLWETISTSVTAVTDGLKREECILLLQKQRYDKIDKPIILDNSRGWTDLKIIPLLLRGWVIGPNHQSYLLHFGAKFYNEPHPRCLHP